MVAVNTADDIDTHSDLEDTRFLHPSYVSEDRADDKPYTAVHKETEGDTTRAIIADFENRALAFAVKRANTEMLDETGTLREHDWVIVDGGEFAVDEVDGVEMVEEYAEEHPVGFCNIVIHSILFEESDHIVSGFTQDTVTLYVEDEGVYEVEYSFY